MIISLPLARAGFKNRAPVLRAALHLLAVAFGFGFAAVPPAGATTYYVAADSTGDYPTIQEAVFACVAGDSVIVGPGIYRDLSKDPQNVYNNVLMVSGVVLKSEQGPLVTFLDATADSIYNPELVSYSRRGAFLDNCDSTTVIEGFTIRGGHDALSSSAGIRIYGGSPRILDNIFVDLYGGIGGSILIEDNMFDEFDTKPAIIGNHFDNSFTCCGIGGAIAALNSSPEIRDNFFDSDSTQFYGAGVAISGFGANGVIADNIFEGNTGVNGGGALGVANDAAPEVYNNIFRLNVAGDDSIAAGGGAVVYLNGAGGSFHDNVIIGNATNTYGGAIYIENASPAISHCTISGNSSDTGAGGIHIVELYDMSASPTFDAVLVTFNEGGAGIQRDGTLGTSSFTNCNVYGNEGEEFAGMTDPTGSDGNQSLDPLLCPGESGTLQDCSPLLGKGGEVLAGARLGEPCECLDSEGPVLEIAVLQNPVLLNQVDIYVASNEPLMADPSVVAAGDPLDVDLVSGGEGPVYRARYTVTAGTCEISATASDASSNETLAQLIFVSCPVIPPGARVVSPDGAMVLEIPAGAVSRPVMLTLYRAVTPGDAESPVEVRYQLGPAGLDLGDAQVSIDLGVLGLSASDASRYGLFLGSGAEAMPLETFRREGEATILATLPRTGSLELREASEGGGAAALPATWMLRQNAPNPFAGMTRISYELPRTSMISLQVYDVEGRLVRTLMNGVMGPGRRSVQWDGRDDAGRVVAPGLYSYHLTHDGGVETKKMLLLR